MKHNFTYFFSEGVGNMFSHGFMSFAAIGITVACLVVTGTFGNLAGPALCRLFRLRSEVAQGVAFGTSSHVIGTSRATEMSQLAGAVSSLSLTLAGIITCIALSFLAQYI